MTAHLITLDPGLRGCGMAWFNVAGQLLHAEYVRNPEKSGNGPRAWAGYERVSLREYHTDYFLAEIPQVYRAGASKGDPDDLIQLAGVVGVWTALIHAEHRTGLKPREWKGQVPKDVHHARLWRDMTEVEKAMVEQAAPPSLRHNVLDAVGLGRYWFNKRSA